MAQTRETGFLRNAVQVTNQGIVFVSGSTTLMSISSSGAITTTGVISGSNALSSSFSLNSALLSGTGSVGFATTGAFATASGSVSSRITQIEQVYATTGSNSFRATQSITGSLTVTGQIIAQTLNVQQVTSSIIFSTGSNTFGCDLGNRQTFTGSVIMTGSLIVNANNSCFSGIITGGSDIILCGTNGNVYGGTSAGSGTISNNNGSTYARFFGASHATTPNTTAFVNANSTSVTINSSGNVGIGISPIDKLHVNGNIISEGCFFSGAPDNLRIFAGHWATVSGNANCYLVFQAGGGNASFGTPNGWGGTASIYTCGQTRLTVGVTGGISTSCGIIAGGSICTQGTCTFLRAHNYTWMGGSGGDYGSVGYNVGYTSTSNTYNYVVTDFASILRFESGGFNFLTAGGGTAGNPISFAQRLFIANGGTAIFSCMLCSNSNIAAGGNINASGNINAGGGVTAGGSLNSGVLNTTTQSLKNSVGGFAKMVHKVQGQSGSFGCVIICVDLRGAGGYGYIVNSGGTSGPAFQSGGGYTNGQINFSHSVAVGSGYSAICIACSGTDNILRLVGPGGVHPFVSIQMFGSLQQDFDDTNISITFL